MNQAIDLFGNLVLLFLGFTTPITGILFSIFYEGVNTIREQYNTEKTQVSDNIKSQLKKIGNAPTQESGVEIPVDNIQDNLEKLQKIEKNTNKKLQILNPKIQIPKLFIVLLISFIGVILAQVTSSTMYLRIFRLTLSVVYIDVFVSVIFFLWGTYLTWSLLEILFEVTQAVSKKQTQKHSEELSSITLLLQKIQKGSLLEKVYFKISDTIIKGGDMKTIELPVEEKTSLPISIMNSERLMVKNLEAGLEFPQEFLIEKKGSYTVYKDEKSQIIRYKDDMLQANTNSLRTPLEMTPLKTGEYDIDLWLKAENLETKNYKIHFKIS